MLKGKLMLKAKIEEGKDNVYLLSICQLYNGYHVEIEGDYICIYKYPECSCDVLYKVLETNFPTFTCSRCGRGYFSPRDAEVIDKMSEGTRKERRAKGLKY